MPRRFRNTKDLRTARERAIKVFGALFSKSACRWRAQSPPRRAHAAKAPKRRFSFAKLFSLRLVRSKRKASKKFCKTIPRRRSRDRMNFDAVKIHSATVSRVPFSRGLKGRALLSAAAFYAIELHCAAFLWRLEAQRKAWQKKRSGISRSAEREGDSVPPPCDLLKKVDQNFFRRAHARCADFSCLKNLISTPISDQTGAGKAFCQAFSRKSGRSRAVRIVLYVLVQPTRTLPLLASHKNS